MIWKHISAGILGIMLFAAWFLALAMSGVFIHIFWDEGNHSVWLRILLSAVEIVKIGCFTFGAFYVVASIHRGLYKS